MNFYRSVIGNGGGSDQDYLTTVNDVAVNPTGVQFFASQFVSGDGLIIGDELSNCTSIFAGAIFKGNKMLKNLHIGNNVRDCSNFMYQAEVRNYVNDTHYTTDLDFNVNITFPMSVEHLDNAFNSVAYSYNGICGNIYINNREIRTNNMLQYRQATHKRLNIFCNRAEWIVSDNPGGWETITNGYYSLSRNVYLYNNYVGT